MSEIYSSNWMGTPYVMPSMNFGGNWLSSPFTFSTSTSSKESGNKPMTYDDYHKKWVEDKKAKEALEEQIMQVEEQKKAEAEIIERAKEGTVNEDTTITVKETKKEFKKLSLWQKIKRGVTNVIDGAITCGMDMFGIEGFLPPKINFKKLGKALLGIGAIAAATCIPVVGPFVIPAAVTMGVGLGVGKVAVGTVKACSTDDPEEFDRATKGIGEGAVIGGLSWTGVRAQGGFMAMWRNAKSLASSTSFFSKTSWKQGYEKLVNPVKNFFSPKAKQAQFRADMNNMQKGINAQIQEIDAQIASSATEAQRTILMEQRGFLEAQSQQLKNANNMSNWANIKNSSEAKKEVTNLNDVLKSLKKGEPVSAGTDAAGNQMLIDASKENIELIKSLNAKNEALAKSLAQLANKRNAVMRSMALRGKGKASVKAYTGSDSRLGQLYNLTKPNIDWNWRLLYKAPWNFIKGAFKLSVKPYEYYYSLTKKGVTTPYNIEQTVSKNIEAGFIGGLISGFGLGTFMGGDQLLTQTIQQKDANGNIVQQAVFVTKDTLAQLEEAQKKYDDTLNQLKAEEKKLGIA